MGKYSESVKMTDEQKKSLNVALMVEEQKKGLEIEHIRAQQSLATAEIALNNAESAYPINWPTIRKCENDMQMAARDVKMLADKIAKLF